MILWHVARSLSKPELDALDAMLQSLDMNIPNQLFTLGS